MPNRPLLLVGILSLCLAGCGGGGGGGGDNSSVNPPAGNIDGVVIDLDGRPVANAQVVLADSAATTDDSGRFHLIARAPGWITVRHPQFLSRTRAAFPEQPLLVRLTPDDGETIALHFGGDTMFGRRYYDLNSDGNTADGLIQIGNEARDQAQLLRYIQPLLANADLTAVNLESPLADKPYFDPNQPRPPVFHPTKDFVFASHPSAARTLRDAGVDVVDLGNNHMYDLLEAGLTETKAGLETAGYAVGVGQFGAGHNDSEAWRPAVITVRGITLAFIGCTGIPGDDQPINYVAAVHKGGAARCASAPLQQAVQAARAQAQVVIVMIHSGFEYGRDPSPTVQQLTATARAAGATLVINHHPHVVGGLNWQANTLAAWTLGNFLFDQDVWPTFESYLLAVHLRRGQVIRAYVEPFIIADYLPRPIIGPMAEFVARGAAGRAPGPFLIEDGVAEVDVDGRAITQEVVTALDGGPNNGAIYRFENGASLAAIQGSGVVLAGRDLLWTGSFEDETADDQVNPGALWDLTDQFIGPDYAYEGQAGVRLRRLFSDGADALLTHKHRILIEPNRKFSVIGRVRTNGGVTLQLSWYPDTKGPSTLQTRVPDLIVANNTWQPFRIDVTYPNFSDANDPDNQLPGKPAVGVFLRLSPPGRDRATADFDNIRLIAWEEPGTPPTLEHDFFRVTGAVSATLRRDVLPGAENWMPPPTVKPVP